LTFAIGKELADTDVSAQRMAIHGKRPELAARKIGDLNCFAMQRKFFWNPVTIQISHVFRGRSAGGGERNHGSAEVIFPFYFWHSDVALAR